MASGRQAAASEPARRVGNSVAVQRESDAGPLHIGLGCLCATELRPGAALGPFHGTFSTTNKAAADAEVSLPAYPIMPTAMPGQKGPQGQGYVYLEGWQVPQPNMTPNSGGPVPPDMEGGVVYQAARGIYIPYIATNNEFDTLGSYQLQSTDTVVMWLGAVGISGDPRKVNAPSDPNEGKLCSAIGGCVGLYLAYYVGYPYNNLIYLDTLYATAYHWIPGNGTCCVFRRMTSISDRSGTMLSQTGSEWSFYAADWMRSFTETFDPSQTPNPDPSATPGTNNADGDGYTDGSWVIGGQDLGGDPAGVANYPRCFARFGGYIGVQPQNNESELVSIYMPVAYPSC